MQEVTPFSDTERPAPVSLIDIAERIDHLRDIVLILSDEHVKTHEALRKLTAAVNTVAANQAVLPCLIAAE